MHFIVKTAEFTKRQQSVNSSLCHTRTNDSSEDLPLAGDTFRSMTVDPISHIFFRAGMRLERVHNDKTLLFCHMDSIT